MSLLKSCLAMACLTFAAQAQTSDTPALEALLKEVRQLRIALERSNLLGPRIQIVMARLQLQQDQVARVSRQLDDTRKEIAASLDLQAHAGEESKLAEARLRETQDFKERAELERALENMKSRQERDKAQEQQLRARESELASQVMAEQSRLTELNDRIVAIERALDGELK